jgi:uroporphyrinogen decarboxylase
MLYKHLTSDIIQYTDLDFIYIWEDMCYMGGPLLSPRKYAEFVYPYLKELVDSIKKHGIEIIVLDSDGDISQLIPWYQKCGVNVLLPFEVQAGMDITVIRDRYPNLGIIGGIDKKVLSSGKEAIEAEVISKVPRLYQSGRYIASIDHSVPPDVPFENFKYYVDLLRSLE